MQLGQSHFLDRISDIKTLMSFLRAISLMLAKYSVSGNARIWSMRWIVTTPTGSDHGSSLSVTYISTINPSRVRHEMCHENKWTQWINWPGTGVCNFLFSRDPRYVDEVDDGCFGPRSRAGALAAIRGLRNGPLQGENNEQDARATPSGDGYHQVRSRRGMGINRLRGGGT